MKRFIQSGNLVRILSIILSFVILFNMSISAFAVSENSSSRSFFTSAQKVLDEAGISYTSQGLYNAVEDFLYSGSYNSGSSLYQNLRDFINYLYFRGYLKTSPTGIPMLDLTPGGSGTNIIDDNALDDAIRRAKRPKGAVPATVVSGNYLQGPSLPHYNYSFVVSEVAGMDFLSFDLNNGPLFFLIPKSQYMSKGYRFIEDRYWNEDLENLTLVYSSHTPDIAYFAKGYDFEGALLYYSDDSDTLFMDMTTEGVPFSVYGNSAYRKAEFCSSHVASGVTSLEPVSLFYSRSPYYDGGDDHYGFNFKAAVGTYDREKREYKLDEYDFTGDGISGPAYSYPNIDNGSWPLVIGNVLFHFQNVNYYFYDGVLYDLGYLEDPYNFIFYVEDNVKGIDAILRGITNITINVSSNGGTGTDYSLDLWKIVQYLDSIDTKLSLILDLLDEKLNALLAKEINFGDIEINLGDFNLETTYNNVYNYYFTLNDDQKADLEADFAVLKSPFNWVFSFINGVSGFLDSFTSAAAAYSTGSGYGDFSAAGTSMPTVSGGSVSAASVSAGSVGEGFMSETVYYAHSSFEPVFYINLSAAESKYDYGTEAVALDLRWYGKYKPLVDKVIVIFCWALFAWRVFKTIPSLINGGDGAYVEANGTEIRENNRWASRAGIL